MNEDLEDLEKIKLKIELLQKQIENLNSSLQQHIQIEIALFKEILKKQKRDVQDLDNKKTKIDKPVLIKLEGSKIKKILEAMKLLGDYLEEITNLVKTPDNDDITIVLKKINHLIKLAKSQKKTIENIILKAPLVKNKGH